MIHKLIYPKYNWELLDYDMIEIDISELDNPLNLSDLKSESISLDSDNTKYIRIASIKFGFGDSETYHYLIDNSFDIPFFKESFEESKKIVRNEFNYLSTEEKKEMYLDNFLIAFDIFTDEQNEKLLKEFYNQDDNSKFPVIYNGKSYSKEECDDTFLAYYTCPEALCGEGGVYFTEGLLIYPDGSTKEF